MLYFSLPFFNIFSHKLFLKIPFRGKMLGSKELGTNVLELYFVMLANHDQIDVGLV